MENGSKELECHVSSVRAETHLLSLIWRGVTQDAPCRSCPTERGATIQMMVPVFSFDRQSIKNPPDPLHVLVFLSLFFRVGIIYAVLAAAPTLSLS